MKVLAAVVIGLVFNTSVVAATTNNCQVYYNQAKTEYQKVKNLKFYASEETDAEVLNNYRNGIQFWTTRYNESIDKYHACLARVRDQERRERLPIIPIIR